MPRWGENPGDRQPHRSDLRSRGLALLELIIVVILTVLLFLTAWHRPMPLHGDAEAGDDDYDKPNTAPLPR